MRLKYRLKEIAHHSLISPISNVTPHSTFKGYGNIMRLMFDNMTITFYLCDKSWLITIICMQYNRLFKTPSMTFSRPSGLWIVALFNTFGRLRTDKAFTMVTGRLAIRSDIAFSLREVQRALMLASVNCYAIKVIIFTP